jgi:hypothetical protein
VGCGGGGAPAPPPAGARGRGGAPDPAARAGHQRRAGHGGRSAAYLHVKPPSTVNAVPVT